MCLKLLKCGHGSSLGAGQVLGLHSNCTDHHLLLTQSTSHEPRTKTDQTQINRHKAAPRGAQKGVPWMCLRQPRSEMDSLTGTQTRNGLRGRGHRRGKAVLSVCQEASRRSWEVRVGE